MLRRINRLSRSIHDTTFRFSQVAIPFSRKMGITRGPSGPITLIIVGARLLIAVNNHTKCDLFTHRNSENLLLEYRPSQCTESLKSQYPSLRDQAIGTCQHSESQIYPLRSSKWCSTSYTTTPLHSMQVALWLAIGSLRRGTAPSVE